VWHDGLFRQSGRPWPVVSSETHPFHGEEYVVCGITTTERAGVVALPDEAWAIGGLPRTSYVSPWFLTTLKHADIDRGVGELSAPTVESVLDELMGYFHFEGSDGATT
jgi:mRNA-degrading endonuclease toxin of MazEF toxin-antitoxin module